jgi:peptide chain release factor 3
VFRPHNGGALLLGAVGQLQLDVVAHRLEHEYSAQARMIPSGYKLARWVTAPTPAELERFIEANAYRIAYDVVDAPAVLYNHKLELSAAQEIWPQVGFHAMREHGGLVVHSAKLAA